MTRADWILVGIVAASGVALIGLGVLLAQAGEATSEVDRDGAIGLRAPLRSSR